MTFNRGEGYLKVMHVKVTYTCSIPGAIRLHGGSTQPVLVLRGAGVRRTGGRLLQHVRRQVRRVAGRNSRQGRRHQRHHPHLRAQPRRHLPRRRVLPRVSTHFVKSKRMSYSNYRHAFDRPRPRRHKKTAVFQKKFNF